VDRDPLVKLPPALAYLGDGSPARPSAGGARYLLGIDGGGTKTLAAVLDVERGELHLGRGGASNPDAAGGLEAAGRVLFEAADEALEGADIGGEKLDGAVLAVAGTDTDAVTAHMGGQRRSREWIVVGDVVGAWAAATEARPGVAAIAGTGSNVFGVGPDGPWRAGGWGHVLGDEGSGYWLGLQSIKAALRDRERSGPETPLSEAAVEFFGASSVDELVATVYSKRPDKSEIAKLATETARFAQQGDVVACELYERGAAELAQQIAAVIRQTGLRGAFPVGLIGGAWKAGAVFVDPLTRAIHKLAPQARVAVAKMEPVGGSLLLAAHARGAEQALAKVNLATLIEDALAERGW
jgi:glucosamine kinase